MIDNLESPFAWATVVWLPYQEGGRKSGSPNTPVYAANCAFPLGGEVDLIPGWPATAIKYSLLLEKHTENSDGSWLCALDFFARDLVSDFVVPGASMLVMEGPKIIGRATITERVKE